MNIRSKKGFTLVEIMIVVVIIGLLAAMAIPAFKQVRRNSIGKAMANDARQIGAAVAQIAIDYPAAMSAPVGSVAPFMYQLSVTGDGQLSSVAMLAPTTPIGDVPVNEVTKYVKKISRGTTGTGGVLTIDYDLNVQPVVGLAIPTASFILNNPQCSPTDVLKGSNASTNAITLIGNDVWFDEEGKVL